MHMGEHSRSLLEVCRQGNGDAGIAGNHFKGADFPVVEFGNVGKACGRQFVEPIDTVDNPGALAAELAQYVRHRLDPSPSEHTGKLTFDTGRVGKRPEKIENGSSTQLDAWTGDMVHGAVMPGCHQKADASFPNGFFHKCHIRVDVYSECC